MAHVLVIGGTGMLADVCISLCTQGYTVSVVGRDALRHEDLKQRLGSRKALLNPVIVDYTDLALMSQYLAEAVSKFGSPVMIISWIHSYAQSAHAIIARLVKNSRCDYFHVRGSIDPRQLAVKGSTQELMESFPAVQYHLVILGFIADAKDFRWLTHNEISKGVLEAVQKRLPVFTVGTLEPFFARPV